MYIEETANTMAGDDEVYIELEDGEEGKNLSVPMDQDYVDIFRRNIIRKKINKKL